MKIFNVGSHQFRESLRELLRELWFSYCSSRGMPFRERNFVFREWNFQFRDLLREYPGTLPELREWPFHSESVFPEIEVVPRITSKYIGGDLFVISRSPKAGHNKAGRSDFRNQRFEPDTGKMRKMRKVPLTPEKQGSEEIPPSKNAENAEIAENADMKTRKMRKMRMTGFSVTGFR